MTTTRQSLFIGTSRTPPVFASLRDLCALAVNSSHPVAGESKAIAMSLECPADLLIMDEPSGRAMARNLDIRITGTLGVRLKEKPNVSPPKYQQNQASCH